MTLSKDADLHVIHPFKCMINKDIKYNLEHHTSMSIMENVDLHVELRTIGTSYKYCIVYYVIHII